VFLHMPIYICSYAVAHLIVPYWLSAGHPWIRSYMDIKVPLDILVFRLLRAYMRSSSLRKAALRVGIIC